MKKIVTFGFLLAALSLVISCASAPPAKPEPEPQPEPQPQPEQPQPQPEQPAVANPDAERDQAESLQQKVDKYGLGNYDKDDYQAAGQALQAGQDAYGKDNAASKKSFLAAVDGYNAVLAKGGPLFLADAQKSADAARKAADDLKASVAVKDDYGKADAVYQRALEEKDAGDIENASKDFADAQAQFTAVAEVAQQKKDAATKAVQEAQQDAATSEQTATDAQNSLVNEGLVPSGS
jgi:colicin import membrane protein